MRTTATNDTSTIITTTTHSLRHVPSVLTGPATARADGALPPTPRWLHEDPYACARMAIGMPWIDRHMLEGRRQRAVDELDALDQEAVEWMRRKREADQEALAVHELLWPPVPAGWARRPPRPDQAPLPPVAADARVLAGVWLRRVSLSLLQLHGELALRDLHILLILYGFTVGGSRPVKALADALGFETGAGPSHPSATGGLRPAVARPAPTSSRPRPRSRAGGLVPGAGVRTRRATGGVQSSDGRGLTPIRWCPAVWK